MKILITILICIIAGIINVYLPQSFQYTWGYLVGGLVTLFIFTYDNIKNNKNKEEK